MIHGFAVGNTNSGGGGGGITAVNISAGSTSSNVTAVTFSNANGVSFGYDGSNITATVATNYQSQGAYLTTAMASNRGSDFVQATAAFAGTNASGTINSTGISVSVAAPSVASINVSAGTTSSNLASVTFSNSNGVSFGLGTGANTGVITATVATNYQSQGAYLTTAALSQDSSKYAGTGFTTATTAGTAIVGTHNTAGLSMGVPAFITTAMASNAATISNINVSAGTTSTNASAFTFSNLNNVSFGLGTGASVGVVTASIATTYAGTGFTTATTAGTAIVGTHNTAGLSMGVPAYITTAMASNAATISNINISAGTTSTNASAFTFSNLNNVSFGLGTGASAGVVTGSIATTYAGTGFTTATTAGTAIVGTLNTSGLSMGVPAYITTADLSQNSSNYAGINSAITGGSMTVNTSGISVNIPIATLSYFEAGVNFAGSSSSSMGMQRLSLQPFIMPQPISIGFARFYFALSQQSASQTGTSVNSSFTMNRSYSHVMIIYTQGTGANSLSLRYSTSASATWVFQSSLSAAAVGSQYTVTYNITYPTQGTTSQYTTSYATSTGQYEFNTTILSLFSSQKYLDIPFAASLSAGNYWLGFGNSTNFASNAGPANLSSASVGFNRIITTMNDGAFGFPGVASNTSPGIYPGCGYFTSGAALSFTSSIALNQISQPAGNDGKAPFLFIRYA